MSWILWAVFTFTAAQPGQPDLVLMYPIETYDAYKDCKSAAYAATIEYRQLHDAIFKDHPAMVGTVCLEISES